jgi:lysyl-tRNA synthetase class 2
MNKNKHLIKADLTTLRHRAAIIHSIRNFFIAKNYLEIETPVLSPHLIPEANIDIFTTTYESSRTAARPFYLTPSPEIWMKQFIAQFKTDVFQITKSFRNCETISPLHNPEFTMLEYYTMNSNEQKAIKLTEELIIAAATACGRSEPVKFKTLSLAEIFYEKTKVQMPAEADKEKLTEALLNTEAGSTGGREAVEDYSAEDIFDLIFVEEIEPEMKKHEAVFLTDFPSFLPTTAEDRAGTPYSCRWELYLNGIETANCYKEKATIKEMKDFFEEEARRSRDKIFSRHEIDYNYCEIFENFPQCAGVALGIDRLILFLLGKESFEEITVKPFSSFLE